MSGPYRGLSQHESAIEVTTVINEQFNDLDTLKRRGLLPRADNSLPRVNEELKRREMDTPGVMDAVYGGWKQFAESEDCYREIVSSDSLYHRRSDLTDENSMKLYCSFFDKATTLTDLDIPYMTGGKQVTDKSRRSQLEPEEKSDVSNSQFMKKAQMLGIQIQQNSSSQLEFPALFAHDEMQDVPTGFEQINENLYARKDNRFMVFNHAGLVDSWPPKSMTKVSGIEDDMKEFKSNKMRVRN